MATFDQLEALKKAEAGKKKISEQKGPSSPFADDKDIEEFRMDCLNFRKRSC